MVKNVCCNFYHSVERSGCDVSGVISIKGETKPFSDVSIVVLLFVWGSTPESV